MRNMAFDYDVDDDLENDNCLESWINLGILLHSTCRGYDSRTVQNEIFV